MTQVKVCGLRLTEDMVAAAASGADYIGMIFYPGSSRYAAGIADPNATDVIAKAYPKVKRAGVFVNAGEDEVRITAEKFCLNTLQFHGDEDPEYCAQFTDEFEVIKAISIGNETDFGSLIMYEGCCHRFLFDTEGPLYGGNGFAWDWSLLYNYSGNIPFLVSGGIGPADILKLGEIRHPFFAGIDINSKFEKYPGVKNNESIRSFIRIIKAGENVIRSQ